MSVKCTYSLSTFIRFAIRSQQMICCILETLLFLAKQNLCINYVNYVVLTCDLFYCVYVQTWAVSSLATNQRTALSDGGDGAGEVAAEGVEGNVEVTHKIYAHRSLPQLLVQDVVVGKVHRSSWCRT